MDWRVEHNSEVDLVVLKWTQTQTTSAAIGKLETAGIVTSRVQNIDDLLIWPHLKSRNMIDAVSHPSLEVLDGLKASGFPIKFGEAETGYSGVATPCGTHNREVLSELLGLNPIAIDDLLERKII